jgi:hypothetical protein
MKEVWLDQRSRLQALGVSSGLPAQGRRGTLSDALTIAELLLLAPNDSAVLEMFRDHQAQAASFLDTANGMDDVIANSTKEPSSTPVDAPYHEFADLVIELLTLLRDEDPAAMDRS